MWAELANLLTDLQFVELKCRCRQIHDLLGDLTSTLSVKGLEKTKHLNLPLLEAFQGFVSSNLDFLEKTPGLTTQQGLNHSNELVVNAAERIQASLSSHAPYFQRIVESQKDDPFVMTLANQAEPVLFASSSLSGDRILASFNDLTAKIFDASSGKELSSLRGLTSLMTCGQFLANQQIVVGSSSGHVQVWDYSKGILIHSFKAHERKVHSLAVEPAGKIFASAGWDARVKLWSAKEGTQIMTIYGHKAPVNCLAFHPEGQLLVSGSWDGHLQIFDTLNRFCVATLKGHTSSIRSVCFSASGRHLFSGSDDGNIKVWSTITNSQVGGINAHSSPLTHLSLSQDGSKLISCAEDGSIKTWSAFLGKQLGSLLRTKEGEADAGSSLEAFATSLTFSKDLRHIAVGYNDGSVSVFETSTGELLHTSKRHKFPVRTVVWSPKFNLIIAGSEDSTITLALPQGGKITQAVPKNAPSPPGPPPTSQAPSSSAQTSGGTGRGRGRGRGGGRKGKAQEAPSNPAPPSAPVPAPAKKKAELPPAPEMITLKGHEGPVTDLTFSENFSNVYSSSEDLSIRIWHPLEGTCAGVMRKHTDIITSISLLPGTSRYLASCSRDMSVIVWNLWGKEPLRVFHQVHNDWINQISWEFEKSSLLTASNDFTMSLINSETGERTASFKGHLAAINCVSASNQFVLSGSSDGQAKLWNRGGAEITTLSGHSLRLNACQLRLEGKNRRLAALSSDDGSVSLWDPLLGDERRSIQAHSSSVTSAAPLGPSRLVSSSTDGSLKVWVASDPPEKAKVKGPGNVLLPLPDSAYPFSHDSAVSSLSLAPGGRFLLSASKSGSVRIWEKSGQPHARVASCTLLHSFKPFESIVTTVSVVSALDDSLLFLLGSTNAEVSLWSFNPQKPKISRNSL